MVVRGCVLPALVLLLVTGCLGKGSMDTEADDEPVVQSSTAQVDSEEAEEIPEEEAIAVYLRFWDAIVLASAEMDPDHPELEEHATGQALELAQQGVQAVADSGQGMEGDPVPAPEVISAEPETDPSTIIIRDCQGAGDWKVVGEGEPRSDNVRVDARITRDVFSWWVTEMQIWGDDSC